MHIGETIHKLRKERKLTLLELSNKSKVAVATLSRIENGKMTGTLKSHTMICDALDIKLPELYRGMSLSKKQVDLHIKREEKDIDIHNKRVSSEILVSRVANKKMMPLIIKIKKGGVTHREETKSGIEKFIYLLDGKIEANIGNEKYNLMKGDTLYFESSEPHQFKNIGTGEARLICVICPPTI